MTAPGEIRIIQNHSQDSTRWNDFEYRDDDIIISTWGKAGTTWMQQIVGQLLNNGDPNLCPNILSPWVEMRVPPADMIMSMVNAQTHRRFLKSHLPADALPWSPKAKYVFVARDGRDMIWSLHHHLAIATPALWQVINETPGRIGPPLGRPPEDPRDLLKDLVEDDNRATIPWPLWSCLRSWWAVRDQPNVLLVHFNDLKTDLDGEMKRIATFLGVNNLTTSQFDAAVKHSGFAWMKEHADRFAPPQAEQVWEGGAKQFINKGTNNRWMDVLSEDENKSYLEKVEKELGPELAEWLKGGRLVQ
ncbi:hypothetical protein NLG97_g534 [Lecanicillium saksenae]|uniref:Uncharacterized protein n=1 Tax=Lecanicillium saksenae TaxID=468837 RepID=A0ACC1R9Q4_9HYPO|nr:hypothetical protein NLG97_g534 [Lecanicillium saksenae]